MTWKIGSQNYQVQMFSSESYGYVMVLLLNLGVTPAINNHRPDTGICIKNNGKRQTFTLT